MNIKASLKALLVAGLALVVFSAYPTIGVTGGPDPKNAIIGNPPADGPFGKLTLGMPRQQVIDLIGPPTDQKAYVTGKAFIPFYAGRDAARLEFHYKGQGIITLTGGSGLTAGAWKVYRIEYNPDESGYVK